MEHIEYAFNAFCKVVLRHESINAWRDLKRKAEREISLDYLMPERYFEPSAMDSYFEKQDKPTDTGRLGRVNIPCAHFLYPQIHTADHPFNLFGCHLIYIEPSAHNLSLLFLSQSIHSSSVSGV